MIVVTGATGHVGRELVAQLAARGAPVRAVTRRPAAFQAPAAVDVVYGDFDDQASINAAFKGADRAFLMSAQAVGRADRPTHDLQLVEAARGAGVQHVVKLSVLDGGAGQDSIGAWTRQAEAAVTQSGMNWTLLRPGRFMSNALAWAPMIRAGDKVTIPFAHRPAASIDPADIAAVATLALLGEGQLASNAAYPLSGPEVLTPAEELERLGAALGRTLELLEPSIEATRAGMFAYGMPEAVVDAVVDRTLHGDEGAEVLPTVEQILGRRPHTFGKWAHDHAYDFVPPEEGSP
jgi:uncharacterized protein YbjT (DUF2867 family)